MSKMKKGKLIENVSDQKKRKENWRTKYEWALY